MSLPCFCACAPTDRLPVDDDSLALVDLIGRTINPSSGRCKGLRVDPRGPSPRRPSCRYRPMRVTRAAENLTPASLGFRMPAEWAPHERCLISAGRRELAHRLGRVLPARPGDATPPWRAPSRASSRSSCSPTPARAAIARSYCGSTTSRSSSCPSTTPGSATAGPSSCSRPGGTLAVADFVFNSWGEKYLPYDNDAAIGRAPLRALRRASASPPRWCSRAAASPSTARAR